MDAKLALVLIFALFALQDSVHAEFFFNRVFPKQADLEFLGLKCVPGRTVIKMREKPVEDVAEEETDSGEDDYRRSHMRFSTDDESCQICVCSVEARDEYCSNRPAMNVNECMRMADLTQQFEKNEPFDHQRALAYRIRRDLIWHEGEIPYPPNSKCKRARSYYSNSLNANDTDLELSSDIDTLLDYGDNSICFYCVCSTSGDAVGCISRNPWYCQFYRDLRNPNAPRHKYRVMFQQDRPAYFRHISWRLRRTMDNGMFDLIENVGDGSTGADSQRCTPFISTYSDCTEENRCEGCNKCTCSVIGRWECETVTGGCEENKDEDDGIGDEQSVKDALDTLLNELEAAEIKKEKIKKQYAPDPLPPPETILVTKINKIPAWDDVNDSEKEFEQFELKNLRRKRSVKEKDADKKNGNETIIFHHTVDEMNEDTLKNTNASGTLSAAKIDMIPSSARRSSPLNNASTPLQIEYTPPLHSQHAADNKVDTTSLHDDQLDLLVHHKMYQMVGNQSQATRNKDLSKLIVNELKGGVAEIIGDKNSPAISNITFTPENDTLTAMAFIAGNLLNKLWNIEKDSDDSLETENMKHKKINDLLDLFKEPLNLRQETFLKNALQQLSTAIENKNIANVSLCENIEELKKTSGIAIVPSSYIPPEKNLPDISKETAATAALNKIGNVLDLIKKYEQTKKTLEDLKNDSIVNSTVRKSLHTDEKTDGLTKDEKTTLNVFGNILESLTKLLIPNKTGKKIMKVTKNKNLFRNDKEVKDRFSNLNLANISLTTKDKIVLDYITHIQNNPNCVLNKNKEKPFLPDIEGDILLNLSEFFKIKSMSDLLKLVDSENKNEKNILREITTASDVTSFENVDTTEATITKTITTKTMKTEKENNNNRFESTKEKLKDHLKTILLDLIELKNISGKSVNENNIEIAEALPCIYNLLKNKKINGNVQAQSKPKIKLSSIVGEDSTTKVKDAVNNLKKELITTQTRRTNIGNGKRPKSAIVWERTLKNVLNKNKLQTRRQLQSDDSKSFDDVKSTITKIETSGSNTYKSIAYLTEVPVGERLLLLKTLALDTKRYISILKDITQFIETVTTFSSDQYKTVSEFLENVNINLNLNEKVINGLEKLKKDTFLFNKEVRPTKTFQVYDAVEKTKEIEKAPPGYNSVKLSRDQIINQLIKNRMTYYLKLKQKAGDRKEEMYRNLAKKIILYLEIGNDKLARELFKTFVAQKNKNPMSSSRYAVSDSVKYESKPVKFERKRISQPEPLIQFEEPNQSKRKKSLVNDELIKQLMSIKNMSV